MSTSRFEPVIGLEIHAELNTRSKMFCSCPVVDSVEAAPNFAVCPVCAGLPGTLPVVNHQAVTYAIKVGLALQCAIHETSIFERKNYFYPDLPKGYQISQYQYPLAEHGMVKLRPGSGQAQVRVNRVHMEEDAGKLTHCVHPDGSACSLVDLNRAGVPLLEIVTEPDIFSVEAMRAYATELRAILRCLGVNSGDLEKGVIRFEANISLRPTGTDQLGTRVEIKNLNSFRSMERAVLYEIERQSMLLEQGGTVNQETRGWNEAENATYVMRSKEDAHDYRYFPEPDLPPLVVDEEWIEAIRAEVPELPSARLQRFIIDYGLQPRTAEIIIEDYAVAEFFEACAQSSETDARQAASWITGALFAWMNQAGVAIDALRVSPFGLAALIDCVEAGRINRATAQTVLNEMLESGKTAEEIIEARGLEQISDVEVIRPLVSKVLVNHSSEVESYLAGNHALLNWFFGQVMRETRGKADPRVLRAELKQMLDAWQEMNR